MEQMDRDSGLIDKGLIRRRFGRALESYRQHATVQGRVNERLITLLKNNTGQSRFNRALEIGCGPGGLAKRLLDEFAVGELHLNDICGEWEEVLRHELGDSFHAFHESDGEAFPFQGRFDLLLSASTVQWFHRPERFFLAAAAHQSKGDVLLFSMFGCENFNEIRTVTGIGLAYPEAEQLKKWLKNDYDVRVYEEELISLRFNSPIEVLRHMKNTGVTATGAAFWGKKDLEAFCSRYNALFVEDGEVKLTYHPIYIYAIKK